MSRRLHSLNSFGFMARVFESRHGYSTGPRMNAALSRDQQQQSTLCDEGLVESDRLSNLELWTTTQSSDEAALEK
jgi:hypothetical protein